MTFHIVLLLLALALAAFAATAETSLTSVSKLRIRTLCEEGDRRARRVAALHADPNAYLSTILTLNTVALIVASEAALLLAFDAFPGVPEVVTTIVLSLVALVACEIVPKSLALRFSEAAALGLGRPIAVLTRGLRPVVGALTWVSGLIVRVATRDREVTGPFVTEEELKMLVTVSEQQGVVELEEREMIHGILEMTDKPVREVMVPRIDVVGVEAAHRLTDVTRLIIEHGHSRIPVYEDTIDNVVGVVYAKDVLRHANTTGEPATAKALAREAYFTPEAKRVGELLHEMQTRKVHMAIVVDEYGGTAGIVTIEDLIEEIVGPIRDEFDIAEQEEVQFLSDHEVLMNARVGVDDVKDLLHIDIEDVDADSIGGLVYERLGEIPKPGASIALGDATLVVESVRRQSIRTVRITSPTPFVTDRSVRDDTNGDAAAAQEER